MAIKRHGLTHTADCGRKAFAEEALRLDQYGRAVLPDGRLTKTEGLQVCDQVACFLEKPKVFVAGSTGELGRRAVLDMLRTGMSIYCGARDEGRIFEVQYQNRTSSKYQMTVIQDVLVEGGREQALEEQLQDASVVVDLAGARFGVDVLRPGLGLDQEEPDRCDLQGTKALVDAAKAKGVKKFIYVSAVLVNGKNLGAEVSDSDAYKNWNNFGSVLEKKLEAEEYIKKSGLDYVIIRPVPMVNDFPKDVGGLFFAKPDTLLLQDGDVGKKVSRDDVGLAVLDAIFNPKASKGTFELTGVPGAQPTPREQWWEPKDGKKSTPA
ncbi:unnamed protein product [Effrenium voratum]|nr:unnamed protein product [Effrenium voratum]